MDKIGQDACPPGVPAEIGLDARGADRDGFDRERSLVDVLEASFRQYAANPAFMCMDRFLTYGELDEMSQRLAAWLQSRGMEKGARVAIMLPNVLQYPVALAGILRAGFVAVGVDPQLAAPALQQQLQAARCEAIVILENHAHTLEQVLGNTSIRHVLVASMGELLGGHGIMVDFVVRHVKRQVPDFSIPQMVRFRAALAQGARMPFEPPRWQPADVAALDYTDDAAGVAVTHGQIVADVLARADWAEPILAQAPQLAFPTIVCALPLHGVAALAACALWGMRLGALNLLIADARDTKDAVQELARYPFHVFPVAHALVDALVRDPGFQHLDFSVLKLCNSRLPIEGPVNDRWQAITGVRIVAEPATSFQ
jgi:long-chain acyl-CoA synthetase